MGQKLECVHCHETNIDFFQFGCLDTISPQAKMNPMFNGNYEWLPKIPIGFYFKCGKCGKDTVVIPNNYDHREYSQDIPDKIIIRPIFQQPEFSITHYIMYDATGLLDQVVLTQNQTIISLNTKQIVIDDGSWHEITPTMFNMFKSKGFEEVGLNVKSTTNDNVDVGKIIGSRNFNGIPEKMELNDTTATTRGTSKGSANATTTT